MFRPGVLRQSSSLRILAACPIYRGVATRVLWSASTSQQCSSCSPQPSSRWPTGQLEDGFHGLSLRPLHVVTFSVLQEQPRKHAGFKFCMLADESLFQAVSALPFSALLQPGLVTVELELKPGLRGAGLGEGGSRFRESGSVTQTSHRLITWTLAGSSRG